MILIEVFAREPLDRKLKHKGDCGTGKYTR
jgi:hypothetical protein